MTRVWAWSVLPAVVFAALIVAFLAFDPLPRLGLSGAPAERVTIERTVLDRHGIALKVRGDGAEPARIAQVQVDEAYWTFQQVPPGPLARLATAWIHIPYHWIEGEAHEIRLVTTTGATFDHSIEVAVASPQPTAEQFGAFAMIGLYVGFVPVALGMLFYPLLRRLGGRGFEFLLALTTGLLAFLLVETIEEGLEMGAHAAEALAAPTLMWLAGLMTFLGLSAVGRRRQGTGVAMASRLALGIGLHNLGEGLAIGVAFAAGEAAFGALLVLGFALHNVTEGIAVAGPLVKARPRFLTFVWLAALAGLPTVPGTWIGGFAFAPHWAALFFGLAAGAILQVMVEVAIYTVRAARAEGRDWSTGTTIAGFGLGLLVMYATGFLVQV